MPPTRSINAAAARVRGADQRTERCSRDRTGNSPAEESSRLIWTVGHSTRTIEEFIDLLRAYQIKILVDVRHFPGSRRFPQFGKSALRQSLAQAGIRYGHLVELGGRRPARADSRNLVWRNASFRGYADYMETQPFRDGIGRLLSIARTGRTAIMCSEAVWWRCHRSMIADFLKAMGVQVRHILSPTKVQEHPYTSAASLVGGRLSYAVSLPVAPRASKGDVPMPPTFKVGDHVGWNSEAGRVRGTIKTIVRSAMKFKGYSVRASKTEPQYLIKSDTTEHLAMHKGSALRKLRPAQAGGTRRARPPRS
jgi:hypothetical protein